MGDQQNFMLVLNEGIARHTDPPDLLNMRQIWVGDGDDVSVSVVGAASKSTLISDVVFPPSVSKSDVTCFHSLLILLLPGFVSL